MQKRVLVLAFPLAVGIDAAAQEFTGSIYGRIVDSTNAVMPGVSITVEGNGIRARGRASPKPTGPIAS